MEQTKNIKLNLLKGIACIGVVFIHVRFPERFGECIAAASSYAVPVFLMTAGYYAYGKDQSVIRRRLMKVVKILAFAYAFFFLYSIAAAIPDHRVAAWLAKHFNWKTPIKYLFFCTIDFAIPLWYLIAMAEVYVLWLVIVKKGREVDSVKIFPILFVLQILLTSFCETMKLAWFWKVNFLTMGLPWFLLGYYLHMPKAEGIRGMSSGRLILLAVTGCAVSVIPYMFHWPIRLNVAGHFPYALGLFALTLKNPGKSTCRLMEFIGEKLTLYMYIFHVPVRGVLVFLLGRAGVNIESKAFIWCRPIMVLFATFFISLAAYALLSKRKLC